VNIGQNIQGKLVLGKQVLGKSIWYQNVYFNLFLVRFVNFHFTKVKCSLRLWILVLRQPGVKGCLEVLQFEPTTLLLPPWLDWIFPMFLIFIGSKINVFVAKSFKSDMVQVPLNVLLPNNVVWSKKISYAKLYLKQHIE